MANLCDRCRLMTTTAEGLAAFTSDEGYEHYSQSQLDDIIINHQCCLYKWLKQMVYPMLELSGPWRRRDHVRIAGQWEDVEIHSEEGLHTDCKHKVRTRPGSS